MREAGTSTSEKGHPTTPTGATGTRDPNQEEHQQQENEDWDLTDEDALPEGTTLSGSKSLMDPYHEDKANSKKTKKTNTDKGKKATPRKRNDGRH